MLLGCPNVVPTETLVWDKRATMAVGRNRCFDNIRLPILLRDRDGFLA